MDSKDFEIGDVVEYELSWWGTPMWTNNVCRGGSGYWEKAEVVDIKNKMIPQYLVTKSLTNGKIYSWPLECNVKYDEHQWSWSGYLRKVGTDPRKTEALVIKCQCGAEKCKTTHSTWCPKFNL